MPLLTSLVFPLAMGLSTDLRELIDDLDPTGLRPVAGVGYHEDSMVFLTRGRYERLSQDDMFNWMEAHEDGVLVVSVDTADKETPPRMQEYMWFGSGTIGFNYTNGKELTLLVMHYDPGFIDRMDRLKQELGSQP